MKYKISSILGYVTIGVFLISIIYITYSNLSNDSMKKDFNEVVKENPFHMIKVESDLIKDFYQFHTITDKNLYTSKKLELTNSVLSSILDEYYPNEGVRKESTSFYIDDILVKDISDKDREYRVILAFPNDLNVRYSEVYITLQSGVITEINSIGEIKL